MTKIYAPKVTFIFNIVFGLGNNFVYAYFLTLKFGIIFKILTLKSNNY